MGVQQLEFEFPDLKDFKESILKILEAYSDITLNEVDIIDLMLQYHPRENNSYHHHRENRNATIRI